ncbi:MAG: tRNA (adenosine(37)-N6)-dimethylallyltransferase MiaA [Gammaproteobacteria bacterium]|nr:tRNA (adenosine(37)-N6)-dimethylallyltransferase MiaA [Gammaproteobacteria bacterium]
MPEAKVILLMGATATGKTELALALSERFEVEIISVDSALIFRDMNIGTAKPEAEVLASVPHHLIDIVDPADSWSVWEFLRQSQQLAADISQRGRIPLLAGGTMMYFHAFEHGLNRLPEADQALRQRLDGEIAEQGLAALHARLAAIDPVSADRIKPTDSQRIQRALEVYELSGQPLSALQQQATVGYGGSLEKIILGASDRSLLHQRIETRFLEMLEKGLVEEVERLWSRPDLNLSLPSMRCVGYRQIWQYLDAELSRQQMLEKALAATRQLAKRQITWLRKQSGCAFYDCLNYRKDAIFRQVEAAYDVL